MACPCLAGHTEIVLSIFLNWVRTNHNLENSKIQEGALRHTKIILSKRLRAVRVWGKEGVIWLNFHALEGFIKIELKVGRVLA